MNKQGSLLSLLITLCKVSEKCARVAQLMRLESSSSLVEEKLGDKNTRFDQDFKTLADVLIQEIVKYEIRTEFPEIPAHCFLGEENGLFKNSDGEYVPLTIVDQTQMLNTLNKLIEVPTLTQELSQLIFSKSEFSIEEDHQRALKDQTIDLSEISLFTDPIDGTNEYIKPFNYESIGKEPFHSKGVQVCTVLIGAFNHNTRAPLAGVVAQPFAFFDETKKWHSKVYWGISISNFLLSNIRNPILEEPEGSNHSSNKSRKRKGDDIQEGRAGEGMKPSETKEKGGSKASEEQREGEETHKPMLLLSESEDPNKRTLLEASFGIKNISGAGNKLLTVALDHAQCYYLSFPSIFRWDTCGPHAILKALGGNILDPITLRPVDYDSSPPHAHPNGIIAYRHEKYLKRISGILEQNRPSKKQKTEEKDL